MGRTKNYITYCSKEKDDSTNELPALKRYKSERIDQVAKEAKKSKADLWILSGKFGLLRSDDPVPDYDEMLTALKVDELVPKVARELKKRKIKEFTFFMRPPNEDPNVLPYLECMGQAAEKAKAAMEIVWI